MVAWQLTQEMERQGITKAALAERMHTSRAQVDRILKAKGNITIETLQRAAALSAASCGLSWSERGRDATDEELQRLGAEPAAEDPEFAAALLREGIDTMLAGDVDTGKADAARLHHFSSSTICYGARKTP